MFHNMTDSLQSTPNIKLICKTKSCLPWCKATFLDVAHVIAGQLELKFENKKIPGLDDQGYMCHKKTLICQEIWPK